MSHFHTNKIPKRW